MATAIAQAGRFQIKQWKPYAKNTLVGFLDIETPSGMLIHGCTLHQKNGSRWIGLPGKQYTKENKETGWTPVIEFPSREVGDRFRDAVLAAFDEFQGQANSQKQPDSREQSW